jgi:hypothetical protein
VKKLPGTLRAAVAWWTTAAAVALGFAVASLLNSRLATPAQQVGLLSLGVLLAVLGLVLGYGSWQLFRGKLAGRGLLTTFGLIGGLPLILRGPRLGLLGAALLIGVVLLWVPPSMAYFKEQARAARAARKKARLAAKGPTRR